MSVKAMDVVLSRLYLDKTFRELLRHDPKAALANFDLTPEEQVRLAKLKKPATFTDLLDLSEADYDRLFNL